jgi:glycerol transport system ATP-binding protein
MPLSAAATMALELKNITKTVGAETHIYPTDLTLERGSFNILLGTTLSGKTTLMQLMAGLERPTAGSLRFDGRDVTGLPVQRRNVSMVYQQFINYPNMTVFENIASPLRVARIDAATVRQRVNGIADLLKISQLLDRRPSELSGGQQQRTAMARALVKDSDLILLDEPLANLDFKLREELRDELPKLFAERNCVVVYATTEPSEALQFGGRTAALHEGRVCQFGPTGEIYRRPDNLTAARVFSEPPINTAKVTKSGQTITLTDNVTWQAPKSMHELDDGPYTIGIRPHHVCPERLAKDMIPIDGTVQVAELSGSESIIHFDAYGNSWVSLSHGVHPFRSGEAATLYADVAKCFYFSDDQQLIAA